MKFVTHASIALFTALCMLGVAAGQSFPSRPIKLIVPFAPGASGDIRGRIFAKAFSEHVGQPVVVENMGGGGGIVGANAIAKSPKDGYTIGLLGTTFMATASLLSSNLPFADADLAPIALVTNSPQAIAVSAKSGFKSIADLVQYAKANPGKLNFGSAGPSSITRLAMEHFNGEAGVNIVHVPYKGIGPALVDLIGGQVQVVVSDVSGLQTHIKSGAVIPLAITSGQRISALPNVPTTAEVGLARVISDNRTGLMMAAGTPPSLVQTLGDAARAVLRKPEVVQQLAQGGVIATPGTADEYWTIVRDERARWAPIIKANNISN